MDAEEKDALARKRAAMLDADRFSKELVTVKTQF
jgi:hypothetical protein